MALNLSLSLQLAAGGNSSSSGGGSLPIALVSNIGFGAGNDATSSAIDTTGANLIVFGVTLNVNDANVTLTVTDSKSNTWTLIATSTSAVEGIKYYYCLNPTVGTGHTFRARNTGPGGSMSGSACVAAFSNAKTSSALDTHSEAASTAPALTVQAGSITPAVGAELLVAILGTAPAAAETVAINSGFTKTDDVPFSPGNYFGTHMAYLIQGAAAAINPAWTVSGTTTANPLVAAIACFKPS